MIEVTIRRSQGIKYQRIPHAPANREDLSHPNETLVDMQVAAMSRRRHGNNAIYKYPQTYGPITHHTAIWP
jgi:hypothetical protein